MSYYSLSRIQSDSNIQNPLQKNTNRKSLSYRSTIFLSHSHNDNDIVINVIEFLLTFGIYVYVDWLDPTMPHITSGKTALAIKERIVQCERFVVLLTENSKESKWVPWELGYADAKKDYQMIAVFPVKRYSFTKESEFDGLEYMQLYQKIEFGQLISTGEPSPVVIPPFETKGATLKQWLG